MTTGSTPYTEILDLTSPTSLCQNLPNYPDDYAGGAIGGLGYNNEPLVCGGDAFNPSKVCYSIVNGIWTKYPYNLTVPRVGSSYAYNPGNTGDGRIVVAGLVLLYYYSI